MPHDRHFLIVLSVKGNHCGVDATDTRGYQQDTIHFHIVNRCAEPHTVGLVFSPENPFTQSPPFSAGSPGSGERPVLKLTVRDDAPIRRYDYQVLLDGQPGPDPVFEVDPF